MSGETFKAKYRDSLVEGQDCADEIMSVLGRLDAIDVDVNRIINLGRDLDSTIDKVSQRVDDLEDVAHTPSRSECESKPQEAGTPTAFPRMSVADLVDRAGWSYHNAKDAPQWKDEIVAELERRIKAATADNITFDDVVRDMTEEQLWDACNNPRPGKTLAMDTVLKELHRRRIEAAKPAPAASEPTSGILMIWSALYGGYLPATPAQIRQAAVDAGLLDTERQKVAENFLHQALLFHNTILEEYSLDNFADRLKWIANRLEAQGQTAYDLRRMAAVLAAASQSAGKGEK